MESVSVPQGRRYEVHILLNQNTLFSFFVLGVRNLKDLNPSPLAIYLNCGRKTKYGTFPCKHVALPQKQPLFPIDFL